MLDPLTLSALAGVGLLAGFVDAVAGGGGLIAIPALLSVGVPPIATLATTKFQGSFGTLMSTFTYWRKGHIALRALLPSVLTTFVGAFVGAATVRHIDTAALQQIVPAALIAIALYFLFAAKLTDEARGARLELKKFLPLIGFCIGFYDGIFGPGTGSFFTMAFVALFGFGMLKATASTKLLNVTSNLAALSLFLLAGDVVWPIAIVMASGQLVGSYLGALTGMRFGAKLIRPLVVTISIAMALRLLLTP